MPDTIPQDVSTTSSVTVGGPTTVSALDFSGDHDWFRINLTAGQAITVTLNGVTLPDPYLRIRDSSGAVVYENDDINLGVNLNSQLSFAAQYTGVYYIDVGSYESAQTPGGTGDYQLNVTTWTQPPIYTNDQIVQQLISGYWGDGTHRFNLGPSRTITVNITGLDAAGQNLALTALGQWSSITGITFSQTTGSAQITFDDNDEGAYTDSNYANGVISTSFVNVDTQWLADYGPNVGGYAYQAYLHEIGHALGLGHAGNYNTTATYPYDALYRNDAWATSVMSYFDQTENTYFAGLGFDRAFLVTPMVADILAMQQLYGLSTTTRNGDTVYGFNSNAGNPFNAAILSNVAFTIFDTGGNDTMDYSQYTFNQVINLNPETFSDIGNRDGNVSIARGTIIENAIGGLGRDTIIGNSVGNTLTGGDNIDTLTGGAGNDTFRDTTDGLNGDTITDFRIGDRVLFTDATLGSFSYGLNGGNLTYTGGTVTLSGPITGPLAISAATGGGVQLTSVLLNTRVDFNGDGRDDILWQHNNGIVTNWLGQANGSMVGNIANFGAPTPSGGHIVGVGDFNGDGRGDILWQHDNGIVTNWLGQANGSMVGNIANFGAPTPSGGHIVGVGDFNGDGRDDILWQHDNGLITDWLGQANGGMVGNIANFGAPTPVGGHIIGVGDFNGDGRDDILWQHDNGLVTDWLGQANGGMVGNIANFGAPTPDGGHIVGIGDFNGDGRDDILWQHDNGLVTNWLGQANGGMVGNIANFGAPTPPGGHIAGIGDYNGDGRDDILWQHDNGLITNWLGQANGSMVGNIANFGAPTPAGGGMVPYDYWL